MDQRSNTRTDAWAQSKEQFSTNDMAEFNNSIESKEVDCLVQISSDTATNKTCPRIWDNVLCWPPTPVNTLAELPCFHELNGITYDTSKNATKWCFENATWNNYTNFEGCIVNQSVLNQPDLPVDYDVNSIIYFVGYTLTFIALVIAVFIFIYFKDLRCLRNTIHTNLMVTYIMVAFLWISNAFLQAYYHTDTTVCAVLMMILYYFYLTNFTWMLVEGLYLYMLVVMTFTRENLRLHTYMIIGWGLPLLDVIIWE
uniref:G-protein coupled receptors family 2 profile 2 domain-containing protein n=1 Tax=Clastoptera arizonana TaxID=38151 RepID=A0A1B6DUU3_9HEMI